MAKIARGIAAAVVLLVVSASSAFAAEGLPGATMSLVWALPFVGILLSIATGPVLFPHLWEHHYGKLTLLWSLLVLVPLWVSFGGDVAVPAVAHTLLLEYVSFIILLFGLFTISGGISLPATSMVPPG